MKHFDLKSLMLAAAMVLAGIAANAQECDKVKEAMNGIIEKYNDTPGVECTTIEKGSGLEIVKMMLKKQFGKQFIKGVTSIVIIDYSGATEETCSSLRKDLDVFLPLLEEFKMSDKEEFKQNKFLRCFAASSSPGVLSHFIIAMEDSKNKTIMHMSGEIVAEEFNPTQSKQ